MFKQTWTDSITWSEMSAAVEKLRGLPAPIAGCQTLSERLLALFVNRQSCLINIYQQRRPRSLSEFEQIEIFWFHSWTKPRYLWRQQYRFIPQDEVSNSLYL